MTNRQEKIKKILRDLGARFLMMNGNSTSLLAVTKIDLTKNEKNATIFFTVFPDGFEKTALEFAKRKRNEFKKFIRENSRLGQIPQLNFEIDIGEKNRQRIEDLLNQS